MKILAVIAGVFFAALYVFGVSKAAGVTEVTLRSRYKDLVNQLQLNCKIGTKVKVHGSKDNNNKDSNGLADNIIKDVKKSLKNG